MRRRLWCFGRTPASLHSPRSVARARGAKSSEASSKWRHSGKRRLTSGRLGGGATLGGCRRVRGSKGEVGFLNRPRFPLLSLRGGHSDARSQGLWMTQWPHAEAQHPTVFAPEAHSYDCRDYGRRVGDDLAFFAMLCPPDVVVKLGPRTPMAGGTRKASWGGPWAWGQVFVVCLCMGFRVRTRFFASGLNGSVMLSDLATRLFWPRS